jgi:hypothetical protein
MSQARLALFLLLMMAVIVVLPPLFSPTEARAAGGTLPATLGMQGGILQRAAATPTPDARSRECMRRSADWERNRTPWSLFLGAVIFLAAIYLLTFLRFKNTVFRVILSAVAAAVLGPAVMAVIVQDSLKVCLTPPGFIGSLTAPMLAWTLAGSLGTLGVIWLLRFLVVRRRFRQELPAA